MVLTVQSSLMFSVPWLFGGRTPACPRLRVHKDRAAASPQQVQTQDFLPGVDECRPHVPWLLVCYALARVGEFLHSACVLLSLGCCMSMSPCT